jgi:hypothetical protein
VAAGAALVLIGLLAGALWHSDRFAGAARRVVWPWSTGAGTLSGSQDFEISPGDILIRRGSDVTIAAAIKRAWPRAVFLHMREAGAQWRRVPMQNSDAPKAFHYLLSGVSGDMDYYVASGYGRSRQFRIQVFDLTRVESIDVAYRYPVYTGMENRTQENSGDISAPEGTRVQLQVTFNRPVHSARLRFDQGPGVDLAVVDNRASGAFVVAQDDAYVVDALDEAGRRNENPVRYLVRASPDAPPEISVTMPGRDLRVMALEEVGIAVSATDDFGLSRLSLTYNVGGRGEQRVDLFNVNAAGNMPVAPFVEKKTLIYLENLKVTPGAVISYFVTAEDNNRVSGPSESMSDIYFLEVINTDEAFQRAAGSAGGGMMGSGGPGAPPSALVENQKRIIAATWKLLMRQRGAPGQTFDEDAGVVAESQKDLAQRTQMSLNRLTERFSFSDESYDRSVLHLREAVGHMLTAAAKLSDRNLEEALGPEQAALQAVLKAESQSRRTAVQMARNSGGAGGSGASQGEREDLRELFDMEMGRLENRYEMPQTAAGSGNAQQDDLLRRLRELAQRQERLYRAQLDARRRQERMTEAQKRRRLEELRREQEELSRQTRALSQRWSRQAGSHGTRSSRNALDQAAERMRETARNLEQGDPAGAAASGRQALRELQAQQERIQRRSASVADLVQELGEKAQQLRTQESDIIRQVENAKSAADRQAGPAEGRSPAGSRDPLAEIAAQKDALTEALNETEELVRATGAKSNASHPEVARRTRQVLRSMISESPQKQIEASKADLRPDRLNFALEKEQAIERSIDRLTGRLQALDALVPKSGEERVRQAADAADALARELEALGRAVEALKMQQRRPARAWESGGRQSAEGGADRQGDLNRLREGLERSRRYAAGLLQPWAPGESWAADARSIQRQLTQAQIEDFMNQPALWQKLIDPVRELASALRGQLTAQLPGDNAFSPSEPAAPPQYESLVETYYRSLSEEEKKSN